jgi:hypothetical protein
MPLYKTSQKGESLLGSLTATGTNQGGGYPLVNNANHEFTTVGAGSGATLPVAELPCKVQITNTGLNSLLVYPPVGGFVNLGSKNAAYSLPSGSSVEFWAADVNKFYITNNGAQASGGVTQLTGDVQTASGSSGATPDLLYGQTNVVTGSISTSQNNWSPTGYLTAGVPSATLIRTTVTAAGVSLTGLVPPTSSPDGFLVTIENAAASTYPLHFVANSGSSSAANRFAFLSDVWIDPGESLQLQYNGVATNWKEFGPHRDLRADIWGTGADGAVTAATGTLSRNMYYTDLTVPASQVLTCEGYDIYVSGTLDISNASAGSFVWNGGAGVTATTATGAAGGTAAIGTNIPLGTQAAGVAGGNGSTTNGSAGTAATGRITLNAVSEAAGGSGGAGSSGSGGGVGTAGAATQAPIPYSIFGGYTANLITSGISGPGGGGGGGNGSTNSGGGGGGGGCPGGTIRIFARKINRGTNATAAIFQAKGGAGGAGANGVAAGGGGGGGGGGGQGGIVLIYHSGLFGSTITGAIDVTGGAGGNGGNLASGASNGVGGYAAPSGSVLVMDMRTGVGTYSAGNPRVTTAIQTGATPTTTQVNL